MAAGIAHPELLICAATPGTMALARSSVGNSSNDAHTASTAMKFPNGSRNCASGTADLRRNTGHNGARAIQRWEQQQRRAHCKHSDEISKWQPELRIRNC